MPGSGCWQKKLADKVQGIVARRLKSPGRKGQCEGLPGPKHLWEKRQMVTNHEVELYLPCTPRGYGPRGLKDCSMNNISREAQCHQAMRRWINNNDIKYKYGKEYLAYLMAPFVTYGFECTDM